MMEDIPPGCPFVVDLLISRGEGDLMHWFPYLNHTSRKKAGKGVRGNPEEQKRSTLLKVGTPFWRQRERSVPRPWDGSHDPWVLRRAKRLVWLLRMRKPESDER